MIRYLMTQRHDWIADTPVSVVQAFAPAAGSKGGRLTD